MTEKLDNPKPHDPTCTPGDRCTVCRLQQMQNSVNAMSRVPPPPVGMPNPHPFHALTGATIGACREDRPCPACRATGAVPLRPALEAELLQSQIELNRANARAAQARATAPTTEAVEAVLDVQCDPGLNWRTAVQLAQQANRIGYIPYGGSPTHAPKTAEQIEADAAWFYALLEKGPPDA